MEDEHAPRHLIDPPSPPGAARPAAVVSGSKTVSASIDVSRRQSEVPSPRDASLFQELLRGFGEMRERMIAAESKVEFLSNLLPEIWARMASQEATAQTSQRNMAETTQEAKIQAAQAAMAAERSHQVVEHLKEMLVADEDARRAADSAASGAKESAQRAEILATRLEEQIRSLAAAHSEIAAIRQEVLDTSERSANDARSFFTNTQQTVDALLRDAKNASDEAAREARGLHLETKRTADHAIQQMDRLGIELSSEVSAVHERLATEELRRAEQERWASELEAALAAYAQQAAQAADIAGEQAALMELREQTAAAARETTTKSVENIMRAARETFVASRDAGDEAISQAKAAAAEAAASSLAATKAVESALEHALGAAEARERHDDAAAEAEKAAHAATETERRAAQLVEEQKDMTAVARQVARSAEDARSASEEASSLARHAEEAARAAAGEAQRIAVAEADRLQAFERSVAELRAASTEAIQAAETTRGLLWQIASDEVKRGETLASLSERYDKELRSLEGAVQSARGAARSAQEASRSARAASTEAIQDAGQAAEAAARATKARISAAPSSEVGEPSPTFQLEGEGPDDPGFWEARELEGTMLAEEDQDEMWVERFRKVWAGRGRRASEEVND